MLSDGFDVMQVPPYDEEHTVHTPEPGSVTRECDGKPGSLFKPQDFPLAAVCVECRHRIRAERWFLSGGWVLVQQGH